MKAQAYVSARRNPLTSRGKMRYNSISNLADINNVKNIFQNTTRISEFENQERTFLDLVNTARQEGPIDITKEEKKIYGATASKRIKFTHNGETGFFTEKNWVLDNDEIVKKVRESRTKEELEVLNRPGVKELVAFFEGDLSGIPDNVDKSSAFEKILLTKFGNEAIPDTLARLSEKEKSIIGNYLSDAKKMDVVRQAGRDLQIKAGEEMSKRNIATSRMAQMMGMTDRVAVSREMTIVDNGKQISGCFMLNAKGTDSRSKEGQWDIYNRGEIDFTTSEFQRESNRMLVFDVICGQIDRNGGNLFYTFSDVGSSGKCTITSIQAIDNDMSFGNARNGMNTIKLIDEEIYESLVALTPDDIRYIMSDLLDEPQINSIINRRQAILDGCKNGKIEIIPKNGWGEKTIEKAKEGDVYRTIEGELTAVHNICAEKEKARANMLKDRMVEVKPAQVQVTPQKQYVLVEMVPNRKHNGVVETNRIEVDLNQEQPITRISPPMDGRARQEVKTAKK